MVLRSAAEDARRKAEILCKSSGVELSDLIRIEYSWNELQIKHSLDVVLMADCCPTPGGGADYDFCPDDIKAGDTVDFLWEIR